MPVISHAAIPLDSAPVQSWPHLRSFVAGDAYLSAVWCDLETNVTCRTLILEYPSLGQDFARPFGDHVRKMTAAGNLARSAHKKRFHLPLTRTSLHAFGHDARYMGFSWVPFYEELADHLVGFRDRQRELVSLLEELRAKGLKVTPSEDKDKSGRRFPLKEIDPFTFIGCFNRSVKIEARFQIAEHIKQFFKINAALPTDFDGIPVLNNQNSWFFSYQKDRKAEDVPRLWDVFLASLKPSPLSSDEFKTAFDAALEVRGVNVNLTQGLFWIRPKTFLSLDGTLRGYLKLALPTEGLSFDYYQKVIADLRAGGITDWLTLSLEAWHGGPGKQDTTTPADNINYWFVGAYWDNTDPADQTDRFLTEGVWINGHKDKYIDKVKAMKVGDRIAIKASGTQKLGLPFDNRGETISRNTIKAIGTIVANPGDGRTVEVEWESKADAREWYFYTSQRAVWGPIKKEKPYAQRLIRFAFSGEDQDYDWFMKEWYGAATKPDKVAGNGSGEDADEDDDDDVIAPQKGAKPYSIADALSEGVFHGEDQLKTMLSRLATKKNLILQGAPGVGKSFLARRLAYALLEASDDSRIEHVQFHPSYSYEDFVRGYRPTGEAGKFELKDGPFLSFCEKAETDDRPHVLIIDEINRGNLSQVFGELFLLLEADKRGGDGVTPIYTHKTGEKIAVPANLHVIGTMNIADRSLALVDFALRRRFAFVTLEPRFSAPSFRSYLRERKMKESLCDRIIQRMNALNEKIAQDIALGPAFRVGHSFFTPRGDDFSTLEDDWFRMVVSTEIDPLLHEYWHDSIDKADSAITELLA